MEACVVSRSQEYVSVENRTWDKEKAYFDKKAWILGASAYFAGRNTDRTSAIRSWRCSVFNTCICRISSLSLEYGDLLAYFHKYGWAPVEPGCIKREENGEIYAIIDTGNRLRDPLTGRPVHVITGEIAENLVATDFFK